MTVKGPVGLKWEGWGSWLTLQVAHPTAGAVQGNGLVNYSKKGNMMELTNRALSYFLSSDPKGKRVTGDVLCRRDCMLYVVIAQLRRREACEWRVLLSNRHMTW